MKISFCGVFLSLSIGLCSTFGQGTAFTYQGRLVNNGAPANGSYDLSFLLFNVNSNGVAVDVAPITNAATPVNNGLFTVVLDFGPGVFNGPSYWLEISVRTNGTGPFTTLTPRQPILASPYAIMAGSASNLLGTVSAGQLSGAIPSVNLSGTYGNAVNFNNGANAFTGDGSGLLNLNASQLTSGTVPSARLPGNVAFLNSNQTFTAQNVFSQGIGIGNPSPIFAVDALAGQAVGRFVTTNSGYGAVIELQNLMTNAYEFLGAINFNNSGYTYPGQIIYIAANPSNQNNDYMQFRVGGNIGLTIQADGRGSDVPSIIGGDWKNSVSPINSGGDAIVGGGWDGGPNQVLSNTAGAFIGAGSANQVGPNLIDSGIMGGYGNAVQDSDSAVLGGYYNYIYPGGVASFIGGGDNNSVAAGYSAVSGGEYNYVASGGDHSFVGSGYYNGAGGSYSAVVGGYENFVQSGGTIGGSFIGGGYYNGIFADNSASAIPGGYDNRIFEYNAYSVISGGSHNSIQGYDYYYTNSNPTAATIAGGYDNQIQFGSPFSSIGGGYGNIISSNGYSSTIVGGIYNTVGGSYATVAGGADNTANGISSFAAGQFARANHAGSFVLSDYEFTYFDSTAADQFSARFIGGVRFETAGAGMTLDGQPVLAGIVPSGSLLGTYANLVNFNNPGNSFSGNGAGLTSLNASQFTTGTIPSSVLSGTYANALNFNNGANSFTGNGSGLTSLNASQLTTGTVPNGALAGSYTNVLTFTNAANVFAGNGSGLTVLSASQLTGTLPSSALSGAYANALTFNNAGNSFSGNGSGLTGLNASQLTGTIPNTALSGTYGNPLTMNNAGNSFGGNGSALTALNASQLTSGTVPSAVFSGTYANPLAFTNAGNNFVGNGSGLVNLNASQLITGTVPSATFGGTYSGLLTFNNSGNSFTGNGTGLTSLNASQLTSGTVPSGALSGVYTNPITMTNGGNIFAGNGTGLTNVNAAKLNGLISSSTNLPSSIAQRDASGNFSAGSVTVSSLTASNVQATGLLRSGSETGTSDPPSAGQVIRRVNSLSAAAGNIIARTDLLTLERDGTFEGLLIRYPAGAGQQTINCVAQTLSGTSIFFHTTLNNPASPGTVQLVTSAQHAIHAQISFGNTRLNGYVTQVVIDRYDDGTTTDNYWVGTLTSSYNQ
jgi:hypothetical protein